MSPSKRDVVSTFVVERKSIDAAKFHFRKAAKDLITGTDRGGSLTGYWKGGKIVLVEMEVGLSNKDVVDDFYYDGGRLFAVKEVVRSFVDFDKNGEIDFSRPKASGESEFYVVASGKVVIAKDFDASVHSKRSSELVAADLIAFSKLAVKAMGSSKTEVDGSAWFR